MIKTRKPASNTAYTPLTQLFTAQKITQSSAQMTHVPIPQNVINSCQNAMLENIDNISMNDICISNDEATNMIQV